MTLEPAPASSDPLIAEVAAGSSRGRRAWRARGRGLPGAFWWLWTGTLVNRAGTFIEPFFVLYLTGPRHLPATTAGLLLTVWGVGSLVSQPLGGALTDRFGRRATLAVSLTATAVALLALAAARGLLLIALVVLVLGTVADMYRPAVTATVADVVPGPDRARAYALEFWAVNLGFSVAAVSAGLLLHLGFSLLFVLDALTTFAFGMIALRFVPETRPVPEGAPARLADPLRLLARDRLLLAATLLVLAYAVLYSQVYVVLPLAVAHAGLPASTYGFVVALNGVLIVVGQPLTLGRLARAPRRLTLPAGIALVGVGVAATPLCTTSWQFALTVAVWTAGEIATAGSFQTIVSDLATPGTRGRYAGALGLAWGGSALFGPILGTAGYTASPTLTGATCLVAGVVVALGQYRLTRVLERRPATVAA